MKTIPEKLFENSMMALSSKIKFTQDQRNNLRDQLLEKEAYLQGLYDAKYTIEELNKK